MNSYSCNISTYSTAGPTHFNVASEGVDKFLVLSRNRMLVLLLQQDLIKAITYRNVAYKSRLENRRPRAAYKPVKWHITLS